MRNLKPIKFLLPAIAASLLIASARSVLAAQFFTTANGGFPGVFIPASTPMATNLGAATWTNATVTAGVVAIP